MAPECSAAQLPAVGLSEAVWFSHNRSRSVRGKQAFIAQQQQRAKAKLEMRKSQAQRTRRVLLSLFFSVVILLHASSPGAVDTSVNSNTNRYQRNRVYEQRSAQYVNPAVVRQQLEQRKRDAELVWQRRLAEMARIRSDAELKARELKIRSEWQRKWRQYK